MSPESLRPASLKRHPLRAPKSGCKTRGWGTDYAIAITMTTNQPRRGKERYFWRFSPFTITFFVSKGSLFNKRCYPLFRPLLVLSRYDAKKLCQLWKLPIYPDQTNEELVFSRNRIRKQLLPALKLFFNPQIEIVLSHLAEIVLLERLQIEALCDKLRGGGGGGAAPRPPRHPLDGLRRPRLYQPLHWREPQGRATGAWLTGRPGIACPFIGRGYPRTLSVFRDRGSYQSTAIKVDGSVCLHQYFYFPKVGGFVKSCF